MRLPPGSWRSPPVASSRSPSQRSATCCTAAAAILRGWAREEASRRTELLLSAPVSRTRWFLATATGTLAAIPVMAVLISAGVGIGAGLAGSAPAVPAAGAVTLGVYSITVAAIGIGAGRLVRPGAGPLLAGIFVAVTFLDELIAPGLSLPGWVHGLALTSHLGMPMIGQWSWGGIAACAAITVAAAGCSAAGSARRDVSR